MKNNTSFGEQPTSQEQTMVKEQATSQEQPVGNEAEDDQTPRATSYLFDKYASYVYAAGIAVGIWYRFIPVIVVCSFLLLLSIGILVWKNAALKNVKGSMEFQKDRLFADEQFSVNLTLLNDKWLPLIWLEWEFPKLKGIMWGEELRDRYVLRFLWLLWFQRISWVQSGKAIHRGVFHSGVISIRSGDGFRFAETEKKLRLAGPLYVYPRLIPIHIPAFTQSLVWGASGKKGGFLEDPLLISGVRNYEAGDEWRKVNWRASARMGTLQTNTYQPIVTKQLLKYLDVRGFVVKEDALDDFLEQRAYEEKQDQAFELMLSVITSMMVHYNEQGVQVGFISNGRDDRGHKLNLQRPSASLTPVLDQLAQITARPSATGMKRLDELVASETLKYPLYIFCETITKQHYEWVVHHRFNGAAIKCFYLNHSEYAEKLSSTAVCIDTLLATNPDRTLKGPVAHETVH